MRIGNGRFYNSSGTNGRGEVESSGEELAAVGQMREKKVMAKIMDLKLVIGMTEVEVRRDNNNDAPQNNNGGRGKGINHTLPLEGEEEEALV